MSIVSFGIGRSSVAMQLNRGYNTLQSAQNLLARYEKQITSERQYQYGSESPYNATTTMTVQAQLERKTQNASNIKSTLSYLGATDSTLSQFTKMSDDAKGMALDALNTTTSDAERNALATTLKQMTQQLYDFGNYSYNGRYMFSGSTTGTPAFSWGADSSTIIYNGNITDVNSWSDTDILSKTNVNGVEAFGAISKPVQGSVDLNPALTSSTLLKNLNGGVGVESGSIRLTYSTNTSTATVDIDLSGCKTIDDVEKAIEKAGQPDFSVDVKLTRDGLVLSLPEGDPGSVVVSEVGKGKVARQLGIATGVRFSADAPLQGTDLNPMVTATTSLDDILGSRATLAMEFPGENNDIVLRADHNGDSVVDPETGETLWPLNGVDVSIEADSEITPGSEQVFYDSETQTITVRIHPDNTTANDIISVINTASEAGTIPPFTASASLDDAKRSDQAGTGNVKLLTGNSIQLGTTAGGSGVDFDPSGIQLVNGNATYSISFENCQTVGDVLAVLNDSTYGLYAAINDSGTGIDIRSRISGADFCIGENGGTTASQFGVRTTDLDTPLSEFDYGRGVSDYDGPGTYASVQYSSVTPNSSLVLTALNEGKAWNDYTLNFVATSDPQGQVTVSMDEDSKTITIGINPGVTTACEIVAAFNAQPGAKEYFSLELDTTDGLNTGAGVVNTSIDGQLKTNGGSDGGIDFTITRNDGTVMEIDIKGAKTLGDVLRIINEHPDNADGKLVATLTQNGNGIQLTDDSFGSSQTRVDRTLLSTSAIELGLVDYGQEYRTATNPGTNAATTIDFGNLNSSILITAKSNGTYANDVNVEFVEGTTSGFEWDASGNGTLRFTIVPGETTANDVVELFRDQATESVRAMFDVQNATNPDGLPSDGSGTVSARTETIDGGSNSVLTGNDPNPKETESYYTALLRMQSAMKTNDIREIERASQMLESATTQLTEARTNIGVMQNSLDNVQYRLSEENIQYQEVLNNVLRIDFADATLNYVAQQVAYQAGLTVTSSMFQMSLLNYL